MLCIYMYINHFLISDPRCDAMVDVVFVLDSSGSIQTNFPTIRQLVTNFVNSADIGTDATLVGVVRFSINSVVLIPLGSITNSADLVDRVNRFSDLTNGTTFTDRGIADATDEFVQRGRQGADRFIIVVTDGQSQDQNQVSRRNITVMRAEEARNMGIRIIAIGIQTDSLDVTELTAIASPGPENVFLTNFTALSNLATDITTVACGKFTNGSQSMPHFSDKHFSATHECIFY